MSPVLPPGPAAVPLMQLFRFLRDPIALFEECAQRFGPCFTLRLPAYYSPLVVVSDPEILQKVFTDSSVKFLVGRWNTLFAAFSGELSLVLQDGEEHLRGRRLLGPCFRGGWTAALDPAVCEIAAEAVEGWTVGRPFPILAEMQKITLTVIERLIFGPLDDGSLSRLNERLPEYLDADSRLYLKLPFLQKDLGPISPWGRFVRLRREVDSLVYALIDARRARSGKADSLLAHMLDASDASAQPLSNRQIRDHIMTLFIAGNITTALTLSWTVYRILRHPEVQRGILEELRTVVGADSLSARHLSSLRYLEATLTETLRLHPVVPYAFARVLTEPAVLGAYHLPAGTAILPSIYLTQRREDLWPEATRFLPERFLKGESEAGGFAYFPFGGGVRRCLGDRFSLHEAKIILAQVFLKVRLRAATRRPIRVVHNSIMHAPSDGMPVLVDDRLPGEPRKPTRARVGPVPDIAPRKRETTW